jgi:alpha-L-fucosidase
MTDYLKAIAVPQVRELLTNYGPVAVLWWDTPVGMTPERVDLLLLRLQPGIITNNRLTGAAAGGEKRGDIDTPEQFIPSTGIPGRDWETCMTMNGTWGYKSYDQNWKSAETLLRNLVDIASKGGNYLLNVGPTAEGLIPEPSVTRLREIGAWMERNGESIYGTTASVFKRLPWGRSTTRRRDALPARFRWPADGRLIVPGLKNEVESASLLADPGRRPLDVAKTGTDTVVSVPAAPPHPICPIVVLRIRGEPEADPALIPPGPDGTVVLKAADAISLGRLRYEEGPDRIGPWARASDRLEWDFRIAEPGAFAVTAEIATTGGGRLRAACGGQRAEAVTPHTGGYDRFQTVPLGSIRIAKPGPASLTLEAVPEGWVAIQFRAVTLRPMK